MQILITGVNGFIGARAAARLAGKGATIVGLDVQPEARVACARYIPLDLGSALAAHALARLAEVDCVVHAGGISDFGDETHNPTRTFDVNVAGSLAVLELARRVRCRRLVLCSTAMVYGPRAGIDREHDEDECPVPISVYGASKLAGEALMHAYAGQYGLDAVALRFTHVYGPGQTTECFVRAMLAAAARGQACHVTQASTSLRQYVHVDDVCRAVELALTAPQPVSRVFNISADEMHTLADVAEVAAAVTGPFAVSFDEARNLPNYQVGKLSILRAREELGYTPRFPLAVGIADYWRASFARPGVPPPPRN